MRFPGTQKNSCRNKHDEIIVESYLKTITKKKPTHSRDKHNTSERSTSISSRKKNTRIAVLLLPLRLQFTSVTVCLSHKWELGLKKK